MGSEQISYFNIGKSLGFSNNESQKKQYIASIDSNIKKLSARSSEEVTDIKKDIETIRTDIGSFDNKITQLRSKMIQEQTNIIAKLVQLKNQINDDSGKIKNQIDDIIMKNNEDLKLITININKWSESINNQNNTLLSKCSELFRNVENNHESFLEKLNVEKENLNELEKGFQFGIAMKSIITAK